MAERVALTPVGVDGQGTTRGSLEVLLLAGAVAAVVTMTAWHGGDLPSQVYRQELTRSFGFLVWDAWWYTGHYLVSYSVLSPVVAALVGLPIAAFLSAALAAWAFDRLVKARRATFGYRRVQAASILFAINLATPILIGQITFLMGEAVGLLAVLASTRRRHVLTAVLACASTLFSPVAGVFVVVALVSMAIVERADRRARILAAGAAVVPMVVSVVLFHGVGTQPFLFPALVVILACCGGGLLFLPRDERALRWGCALYGLGSIATFVVANPLGGNVARLAGAVAAPLAIAMVRVDRRKIVSLGVAGLLVWQWTPAVSGLISSSGDPSRHPEYFAPLVARLGSGAQSERVEIPFTKQHWEAAYVAPHVPLARGWERQTDRANNPLFYTDRPLTAARYKAWLYHNGVSWVALPDVPLDSSSIAEAALIRKGLPYLRLEWKNAHWKLWKVVGSPGLVSGPATMSMPKPDKLVVRARRPATLLLRVRYTPTWHVTEGNACPGRSPAGWTTLRVPARETVELVASPSLAGNDCQG